MEVTHWPFMLWGTKWMGTCFVSIFSLLSMMTEIPLPVMLEGHHYNCVTFCLDSLEYNTPVLCIMLPGNFEPSHFYINCSSVSLVCNVEYILHHFLWKTYWMKKKNRRQITDINLLEKEQLLVACVMTKIIFISLILPCLLSLWCNKVRLGYLILWSWPGPHKVKWDPTDRVAVRRNYGISCFAVLLL